MTARHRKLPTIWLMTDERVDEVTLLRAVARLPPGAGIVFRHYGLAAAERRALFERVRRMAARRRLTLLLAGDARMAAAWRADGWHGHKQGRRQRKMLHSAPAHSVAEMRAAERAGADMLFISPVFPTRSHPGQPALGSTRFAALAGMARKPVIALGGMTEKRAAALRSAGIHGWAAIDALIS